MSETEVRPLLPDKPIIYPALLLFLALLCSGCTVDLFGLFYSTDLDIRLEAQDSFRLLRPEDKTLALGDEYSFIVVSDLHIENRDVHGFENLKSIIDNSDIEFVVAAGDISQSGYREELALFAGIARDLGVPCYPVIGNHDVYFGGWSNWKDVIGSTRYRIDGGDTTLFILDSANAFFGKPQLDWLERELRTAGNRVFVFTHANLFVESPIDIQQFTDVKERARVISILKDRCDAMFMGHVHARNKIEAGGVQYITIDDFKDNKTYCRVHVKADNVSWEFLKLF